MSVAQPASAAPSRAVAWWRRGRESLAPLLVLVVLAALIIWRESQLHGQSHFLSANNLRNVLTRNVPLALIALGQTTVIIAGHIDLSVGSVMALAAVVAARVLNADLPLPLALLAALAVGSACGFLNGWVTTRARLPSFIVTLAMMGLARGLSLVLTGGRTLSGAFAVRDLVDPRVAPPDGGSPLPVAVPPPVWLLVVLALLLWLLLSRAVLGRNLYAGGANPTAARLSGVRVDRNTILVFTLTGLLVGAAAVIELGRNTSINPNAGQLMELDTIAAAVIGGASLAGGQGSVGGTLLGVGIMAVLHNGANLLGIANEWEKVIIGPLIVLAVLYDRWVRARRG